jgi:transcriptional regulator with XRE-family HTH domain
MEAAIRARVAEDLERLLADSGMSAAALARAAGISHAFVSKILARTARPTFDTLAKLAVPLGADVAARLYPNTGPTVQDRHQAPILEHLLGILGGQWRPFTEVSVWKPVRGAIDVVLHDRRAGLVVATEIESDMRRIEQVVRWSKQKAEALPSWSGWDGVAGADGSRPRVAQLLIVRRTRGNERIAREFARQLALAYPAHPDDAIAALHGDTPWPGSAIVWARTDRNAVRLLATR